MPRQPKRYLGDGVYVVPEASGMFKLTTEDGVRATNTIYLEPAVFDALVQYVRVECAADVEDVQV